MVQPDRTHNIHCMRYCMLGN